MQLHPQSFQVQHTGGKRLTKAVRAAGEFINGGEIKQQEVFNLVQTKFVSSVGADSVLD